MNWVTIFVTSLVTVCLTLAAIHALVWWNRRNSLGNLMLSLSAVGTAGLACCELWMMRSSTPVEFGEALRWLHVPGTLLILGLVGFIRIHLNAGILWLGLMVCAVRLIALGLNFVFEPNLNYLQITSLRQVDFLGEQVTIAEGVPNPWMLVGQASLLLLVTFATHAAIQIARRDGWGWSSMIAASASFFVILGSAQVVVVLWGLADFPFTPSLFYLPIVVFMGLGLSHDLLRAASLTDELADREEQMDLAARAANLGMWVRSLKNDTFWATEKCRELFDLPASEPLTANAMIARIDRRDHDKTEHTVAAAIDEKHLFHCEFRVAQSSGRPRWIRAVGKADYDPGGRPILLRGICADVTSIKLADQEAHRLRDELAHASRVNLMGQLASALAHELNQPLAAILRNSEAAGMLLEQVKPDKHEISEIIRDIGMDSSRASEVIDRMRSMLVRREAITSVVDPVKLVTEVLLMLQSDAQARGVELQTDVKSKLPMIHGDDVQLRQVLMNLVLNGMHAAAESVEERRVCIGAAWHPEGDVEFVIADTGPGVPPEKAAQIFEPFFTTKSEGMGIGLALCRSIVDAHGGRLDLEKRTSSGAVFRVRLPHCESPCESGERNSLRR